MATELTTLEEVQALAGEELRSPETEKARAWIVTVSALIRQAVPTVDDRMATGVLDPALVHAVATEAVYRALQADRIGFRVRSEAFPEVTTSYRDSDDSLVYLLDSEITLLAPAPPPSRGAFSIFPRETS